MLDSRHKQVLTTLLASRTGLRNLTETNEREMTGLARCFHQLATLAKQNLRVAAETAACVEGGQLESVPAKVAEFCGSTKAELRKRLEAVTRLLQVLTCIAECFDELSQTMAHQRAVAVQFKALSVLTQVEIANLGGADEDMCHLTEELSRFAENVSAETIRISGDTEWQRLKVQDALRFFANGIPRMQRQLERMEGEVECVLPGVRLRLSQLQSVPAMLRNCLQQTSEKIEGVVTAVQGHDITRQQLEHVRAALAMLADGISTSGTGPNGIAGPGNTHAGLRVQKMQLQHVRDTMEAWVFQIRDCVADIGRLSAANLTEIGQKVMEEERALAWQLAEIQNLQQASLEQAEIIRGSLEHISGLLEVVDEHMRRSEQIRDELQLLVLNSIVGSMRMGPEGAVVSRIAKLINGSSERWNSDILESKRMLTRIADLVREMNEVMSVFATESCQRAEQEHQQTQWTLERVGAIAVKAAGQAVQIDTVTDQMRMKIRTLQKAMHQLESGFEELETVLLNVDHAIHELAALDRGVVNHEDSTELERTLSSLFTTETERLVMQAALHGGSMPVPQQSLSGNDVELF